MTSLNHTGQGCGDSDGKVPTWTVQTSPKLGMFTELIFYSRNQEVDLTAGASGAVEWRLF